MKSLIYKSAMFFSVVGVLLISYLTKSTSEINTNQEVVSYAIPDTQFIISAFNSGNYNLYDTIADLNFNMWHYYSDIDEGWDHNTSDNYLNSPSIYESLIMGKLNTNKSNNLRTFMDRPTIQYLIGGQRSDFQCERIDTTNKHTTPYWFYGYNNSLVDYNLEIHDTVDYSQYGLYEDGSRAKVKHCKKNTNNENNIYLIDEKLRSNRELAFNYGQDYTNAESWDWYIMPRIRIDSAYAADTAHNKDTVCRILITDWDDDTVKNVFITVRNFKTDPYSFYNGNYIDSFYFVGNQENLFLNKILDSLFCKPGGNYSLGWNDTCHNDFKVYWYGKCDMWIDRIRIENEPAHKFLTSKENWLATKLNAEIDWASAYQTAGQIPNYIYFEECTFNHFPVIQEINKQIMTRTGNTNSLVIWLNYGLFKIHIPNCWNYEMTDEELKKYLYDDFGIRTAVFGSYSLEGWSDYNLIGEPSRFKSYHPNTLTTSNYDSSNGILSYPISPSGYDNWLQGHLDSGIGFNKFIYIYKKMDYFSKLSGMRIIGCPQAHFVYSPGHKLKEPSNEEIELQTDLAISYNAKGIIYFCYDSYGQYPYIYGRGIMSDTIINSVYHLKPRINSFYGQNKYNAVKEISTKLKKWGPYLINFNPTSTHSYIHRTERSNLISETYYKDIITYPPDISNQNNPASVAEDPEYRYLQAAVFENTNESYNKYTMVLNRRCSPYSDTGDYGGKRFVKIEFDSSSSSFSGFNNWKIIDLSSDSTIVTFDKRDNTLLNLGWFFPGEGKLYKIAPVMQEGGTLVADEEFGGVTFVCNDSVINNGYDITINSNTTISFKPSGRIIMNDGDFHCGCDNPESPYPIQFTSYNNGQWHGIELNGCTKVEIHNTSFSNLNYTEPPTYYLNSALFLNNVLEMNISECLFSMNNEAGGIGILYTDSIYTENFNSYIGYCNFEVVSGNSTDPLPLEVNSLAGNYLPVRVEYCTFDNNSGNSVSLAVSVTGLAAGLFKNNTISDFATGINILNSSVDLFGNTISVNQNECNGIFASSGSNLSLSPSGIYYTGGENNIFVEGQNSRCINVDNSYFYLSGGYNTFSIYDVESDSSYHLYGTFPGESESQQKAELNCFKIDNEESTPVYDVRWENNVPVEFIFEDYYCSSYQQNQEYAVFTAEGMINDTVYLRTGGNGGGSSGGTRGESEKGNNITENQTTIQNILDSINICLRKRLFISAETMSYNLINLFPDSLFTIDLLTKLYYAETALDSAGNKINPLKTCFENLILYHSNNTALVNRCFYLIQKCKVILKQYESALQGFALIIQQNPYTYEGLVASWDYAATQILDSLGGAGGMRGNGINITEEFKDENIIPEILDYITNEKYDSLKFSKKQQKQITKTLNTVFTESKNKQEENIKKLEKKSEEGNEKLKRELQTLKTLSEAVKLKHPKNTVELRNIIKTDITKVFSSKVNNDNKKSSQIPKSFNLYQNYPNPFNPITKISFDLPNATNVKLIVYDILGREIARLLNNEYKEAGKHIIEFDAIKYNLASGVYFYRIETKDFNSVKKAILLK